MVAATVAVVSTPPTAGSVDAAPVSALVQPATRDRVAAAGTLGTVLFDLDGTLNDSQLGIISSLRHAFVVNGLDDPGHDALRPAIGPPFEVELPRFGVTEELFDDVVDTYRVRYEEIGLFEAELFPGVIELLDAVAALGVRLAIATAKPEPTAIRILEHTGLAARFETIAGATHHRTGADSRRTKGEVITEALARLGIEPATASDQVVMIGDRDHDVEGASEHGIATIGVAWGYGSPGELLGAGASVVCTTPGEVARHLAGTYRS